LLLAFVQFVITHFSHLAALCFSSFGLFLFLLIWLFGRQPILRLLTGKIKKPFGEVSPSVQQDLFGRDGVGLAVNLYMLFFIKRKSQRQNGLPAAVLWGVSCQQSPLNFYLRTLCSSSSPPAATASLIAGSIMEVLT
jgi:hypothetical protein